MITGIIASVVGFFGLVSVASAQVATSSLTDAVNDTATNAFDWLVDTLPTVALYVIPLILLWMFIRFVFGALRGR